LKKLRPYQEDALRVLSRDTSGLVGSDLGTGKTLVAVERVRQLGPGPRVLVIAPVNTHHQWLQAFGEQYPPLAGSPYLRIIGTPRSDQESWDNYILEKRPGIYIMSWEGMRGATGEDLRRASNAAGTKKLTVRAVQQGMREGKIPPWTRTGTWDLIIADEVHRAARRDSANKMVLTRIKAHQKLGLSATPAGNKPSGLWSVLNWLWPKEYRSFWAWAETWLDVEEQRTGGGYLRESALSEKRPGEAWVDIPCKVRHRLEDVGGLIPEVIERIVTVPMGAKQQRIYDDFMDQSLAWIDNQPVAAPLPVSQRIRLRQAALGQLKARYSCDEMDIDFVEGGEQPKLAAIRDILADLPDGERVLLFTHSSKWAHMAARNLGKTGRFGEVRAWTGDLNAKQREDLKRSFIDGGVRVLVAQIQAIAEGTDGLQHVCRCEIWASPTEDEEMANEQARGRLKRPGQKHPVQRWVLHSAGTIDEDIDRSLRARREQMRTVYRDASAPHGVLTSQ
jgi:superfamily II DNA or RNA helicase